ncbi:protein of unknown function [Pararobbsia alpina]
MAFVRLLVECVFLCVCPQRYFHSYRDGTCSRFLLHWIEYTSFICTCHSYVFRQCMIDLPIRSSRSHDLDTCAASFPIGKVRAQPAH